MVAVILTSHFSLLPAAVSRAQAPTQPASTPGAPQEENYVDNGEFELRTPDGWAQGWERVQMSADAKIEVTQASGGSAAVHMAGVTKKSTAGVRALVKPFPDVTELRIAVRYEGTKGQRSIILQREAADPKAKPVEQKIALDPSSDWKPFETTVPTTPASTPAAAAPPGPRPPGAAPTVPGTAAVKPGGKWWIVLLHEGAGESWFDGVQVFAGPAPERTTQPTLAELGPYITQYYPADSSVVRVNPPRLHWPGHSGALYRLEWSKSPEFPAESTKRADGLTLNAFVLPDLLDPGTWYWRVTESSAPPVGVPLPGQAGPGKGTTPQPLLPGAPTPAPAGAGPGQPQPSTPATGAPSPAAPAQSPAPPGTSKPAPPGGTPTQPPPAPKAKPTPKPQPEPKPKKPPRSKLPQPDEASPEDKRAAGAAPVASAAGELPPPEEPSPAGRPGAVPPPPKKSPSTGTGVSRPPFAPGGLGTAQPWTPGVGTMGPGTPSPTPGMPGAFGTLQPGVPTGPTTGLPGRGVTPPPGTGGPGQPPGEGLHAPLPSGPLISPARSFRLDEAAAKLPMPTAEAVIAALAGHPRVWLTMDRVVGLRTQCQGALRAQWEALKAYLDPLKGKDLPADPPAPVKSKKPNPKEADTGAATLKAATQESGLVRDFAFAGLVTSDASYTDEAKRRALNLAGWKPDGATSYANNDQAHREITLALALALDWIPSLSPEDKKKLTDALTPRGEALMKAVSTGPRPLNQFPYSSHGETAVGVLTVVGLAAAGDVPEAEAWLKFALPTAVDFFSPWAGDDGGWMQGDYYWKRSAYYTFQLFDAVKSAGGADLYSLPWSQNTAKCLTYMHPPYSPRGGFGDGPEVPPDARDKLAMWRLASARSDPLAAWYAQAVPGADPAPSAFNVLWYDPSVKPQAPDTLPPTASFPDSGLFAMHSSVTDAHGVHLYGRASAFGSFNHAHADQNSFRLEAFGEPLLIDAGYYDSFRSPHETAFAGTSLAHNTLLVNGKGQRDNDLTAKGKLERFFTSEGFDFAQTEAGAAYAQPLVKGFRREFIFCRPNLFVIRDHVEAGEKAAYTWLLHSLDQPTLDAAASTATVRHGKAGVVVGAFGSQRVGWQTTSKFPKNPAMAATEDQAPPQWHTSLNAGKNETADQLLILCPFEGEKGPAVKSVEVKGGIGAEANADWGRVLALARVGKDPIVAGDLTADAECVVARMGGAGPESLFADQLKSLKRGEVVLLTSSGPCLVSGTLGEKAALVFEVKDTSTVTLALAAQPVKVRIDGQEKPVSWANGVLTITVPAGRHEVRVGA